MTQEVSTYLYQTKGGSDKEYHIHLRRQGDKWMAQYANGKRGAVGKTKPIVENVSFEEAEEAYKAKLKEKLKGGYTPDESGVRFTNTELAEQSSGHVSQQPISITEDQAQALINDRDWYMQLKAMGENRPIQIRPDGVRGINKRGLFVNVPETWAPEFKRLGDCDLDGEQIGTTIHIFDATRINGINIKNFSYMERQSQLERLFQEHESHLPSMKLLRPATTREGKQALLDEIKKSGLEGVVFKHALSPYQEGKSKNTLKFKLVESSTCIVIKKNKQRSVEVGLLDSAGNVVSVGNVTIPESRDIPNENDLVEVEYLYYNPGGSFQELTYHELGVRTDVAREECTFAQVTRMPPGKDVEIDLDGNRIEEPTDIQRPRG
jgi:bifunctional non-homologous end joining protein LigD